MQGFISRVAEHSTVIALALTTLGLLLNVLSSRTTRALPMKKERYEKIIFPIFDLIEPFLYKYELFLEKSILKGINEIIEKNKHLAGYALLLYILGSEKNKNKKSYIKLCNYINSQHDYLCTEIGVSKRSHKYKKENQQYPNKIKLLKADFIYYSKLIILYFVMAFIILTVLLLIIVSFIDVAT